MRRDLVLAAFGLLVLGNAIAPYTAQLLGFVAGGVLVQLGIGALALVTLARALPASS